MVAAVNKDQTITIIGECFGRNLPDMDDTAEILRILGAGRTVNIANATFPVDGLKDYPGPVDAVMFLKTASSVQDGSRTEKEVAKDSDGKTITDAEGKPVQREVPIYERSVTVNIFYEIARTRDSSPLGQGTKSATSGKSSNRDRSKLPDPAELVARAIDKPLAEFISEIVPMQRSMSVTLAKESDNKDAKKEMGAAEKLVKERKYADAAAAVVLMEALVKETGNSTAQATLAEMQRRNASNQRAAAQLSQ